MLAVAPGLWTRHFTSDPAVLASAASYFQWAGPCYGLFGLGLSLYFSSLGAGRAFGPVMAGTVRLVVVAGVGAALAWAQPPPCAIVALSGLAVAAYRVSAVLAVRLGAGDGEGG